MILVWGFKGYAKMLGVLTFVCGYCHNPAAQRVTEYVRKFTFFWIPLFTTKRQVVITCAFCGGESVVPNERVPEVLADLEMSQEGRAAEQYPSQQPAREQLPE